MSGLFDEQTYRVPCRIVHLGSMLVGALSPEDAKAAAQGADGQTAIFMIDAVESVEVVGEPTDHTRENP